MGELSLSLSIGIRYFCGIRIDVIRLRSQKLSEGHSVNCNIIMVGSYEGKDAIQGSACILMTSATQLQFRIRRSASGLVIPSQFLHLHGAGVLFHVFLGLPLAVKVGKVSAETSKTTSLLLYLGLLAALGLCWGSRFITGAAVIIGKTVRMSQV